jgi:hypothetical protein
MDKNGDYNAKQYKPYSDKYHVFFPMLDLELKNQKDMKYKGSYLGRRRGPVGDVRCIIGGSVSMIKVYSTHL